MSFEIRIDNHTGTAQTYSVIADEAQIEGADSSNVYSNVMQRAWSVPPQGTAVFRISTKYTAILGTVKGGLDVGNAVNVFSYSLLGIGQTVDVTYDHDTFLFGPMSQQDGPPDVIRMLIAGGFGRKEVDAQNLVVGLGSQNPWDEGNKAISPIYTWTPSSLSRYLISPPGIFYVLVGDHKQGEVIDVRRMDKSGLLKIDTKKGDRFAFIQNEDGSFTARE